MTLETSDHQVIRGIAESELSISKPAEQTSAPESDSNIISSTAENIPQAMEVDQSEQDSLISTSKIKWKRRKKRRRHNDDDMEEARGDADEQGLVWKNGVGYLPGSTMKFRINDLGLVELMDDGTSSVIPNVHSGDSTEDGVMFETTDLGLTSTTPGTDPGTAGGLLFEERFLGEESTSIYGRKRKHRVIDGEVVGLSARRDRLADLEKSRKRKFDWESYLAQEKAIVAPRDGILHLAQVTNHASMHPEWSSDVDAVQEQFSVGDKLEGVDPHHESLICVLTVAEVCGHRVRLHFDGYSEIFDYWTNSYSPFIFPAGWCAANGRVLQPPKGMIREEFSWDDYLTRTRSRGVDPLLFTTPWTLPDPGHQFRPGMKLEAVDKRNPQMTCVATVCDVIGDFVLVHFDGWDIGFDQWGHIASPFLRPVGYCEENEKILSLPSAWSDRLSSFTWEGYLTETNSRPVPQDAFPARPDTCLESGMRLEAVDKRCPSLVRVASVVSVTGGILTLHYEGWPDRLNVEMEEDCPDIFPVGYCERQGHPLQPPPSLQDHLLNETGSGCPTPGCRGYGHVKGPKYTTHQRASGCPYSELNLKKDLVFDRLQEGSKRRGFAINPTQGMELAPPSPTVSLASDLDSNPPLEDEVKNEEQEMKMNGMEDDATIEEEKPPISAPVDPELLPTSTTHLAEPQTMFKVKRKRGRPRKSDVLAKSVQSTSSSGPDLSNHVESTSTPQLPNSLPRMRPSPQPPPSLIPSLSAGALRSVFGVDSTPYRPGVEEQRLLRNGVISRLLPQSVLPPENPDDGNVSEWTAQRVAEFVAEIPGCRLVAHVFVENEIDGAALLCLQQSDLLKILKMKLGPAVKVSSAIICLRDQLAIKTTC